MSKIKNCNLFEWRSLRLLLAAGLCVGITLGLLNYSPKELPVQLAPEISHQKAIPERASLPRSSEKEVYRFEPVYSRYSSSQSFLPTYQNYQIAVGDPSGIRLKTIVNR